MAIPESQLEAWSHQGSVAQSRDTYATVKRALSDSRAVYASKNFDVFLQGSYGNDTNIYAESDVDIVIRLNDIFRSNKHELPQEQRAAFDATFPSATYTFTEFKNSVNARLTDAFGRMAVAPGSKAIKIKSNGSRRSADVVACFQYRKFRKPGGQFNQDNYVPGIIFPTSSGSEVINYPQQHSENCTAKHQATNSWLKPMIRIVKNMRSKLVDDEIISSDTAPSYFIEGLLYNVPDDKFGGTYGDTFCNCLNWLRTSDHSKLKCANEQYWLLGNSNVQWTSAKCDEFLIALVKLWTTW